MKKTLAEICEYLQGELVGDGSILIQGVGSTESVNKNQITYAQNAKYLRIALQSEAAAIVVGADECDLEGRSGIKVADPKGAFVELLHLFHPAAVPEAGIHPTAVIGDQVSIGDGVCIRAHAVIEDHVSLGAGCVIGAGTVVGKGSTLGNHSILHANVTLYEDVIIGSRVIIHSGSVIGGDGFGYIFREGHYLKVPQVGNVIIEDDVEIGCNVCVDCATVGSTIIHAGTKIDNQVQIAHNDEIGQHVVMSGQVGLAGSVTVGDYSILGGKVGVVDHVKIGKHVQVGGASVITKDTKDGESLWGYPARPTQEMMRQLAALAQLPKLLGGIRKLLKRDA